MWLLIHFVLAYLATLSNQRDLNQTILFEAFGYNNESVYIDLEKQSIESIHLLTFSGLINLQVLHLEDNKIKHIEKGLFKDLVSLRELWLESNTLISFDKEALIGLHDLELVCLNNNPLQELFPNQLASLCESNPKCVLKIAEKCLHKSTTSKPVTNSMKDKIDELISMFQLFQQKQEEKINRLEESIQISNDTIIQLQQQIEEQKYLNYRTENMLKVFNKTDANLNLLTIKVNEMYTKLDSIGLYSIAQYYKGVRLIKHMNAWIGTVKNIDECFKKCLSYQGCLAVTFNVANNKDCHFYDKQKPEYKNETGWDAISINSIY